MILIQRKEGYKNEFNQEKEEGQTNLQKDQEKIS